VIEATQKKLAEARFFLGHMREEANKPNRQNPDAFDHYLSAFISAARSVLWVLHHERKEEWENFEPGWKSRLTGDESKLLKFTNEQRIESVKKKGASTTVEFVMVPMIRLHGHRSVPAHLAQFGGLFEAGNKIGVPVHHFDVEGTKTEVIELCNRYLRFLEKTIEEFLGAQN
jgi:hypothetical protein